MTFNEFTSILATIGVEHHIDPKDVASIGKSILSKHDLKDISSVYFENGGISIVVGKHRKTCLVAADEFNDKDLRRAIHDLFIEYAKRAAKHGKSRPEILSDYMDLIMTTLAHHNSDIFGGSKNGN